MAPVADLRHAPFKRTRRAESVKRLQRGGKTENLLVSMLQDDRQLGDPLRFVDSRPRVLERDRAIEHRSFWS